MKIKIVAARIRPTQTETAGEVLILCSHPNLNVNDKNFGFTLLNLNNAHLTDLLDVKISIAGVNVLLGQDADHLTRPLEYKSGDRNDPCEGKTSMGWTVDGALPKTVTN